MKNEDKALLLTQVQTDVALVSVLSVISIFFLGALLPQFNSYDLSVKIPISFLIVSTFAFLLSSLILSNASQIIIAGNEEKTKRYLAWGYAICEYLGIVVMLLSVPLAMSIVTEDFYIRSVTFLAAIVGIGVYQFMGFSNLDNHFSKSHKLFASVTFLLGVLLFLSQTFDLYFTAFSVVFLLFMAVVTVLAPLEEFK